METIGRIVLIPKGAYNSSETYNRLDWVRSGNKAWVCKLDGTTNVYPVEGANWTVLAQDGSSDVTWDTLGEKPFDDIDNDTLKVNPTTHELYVDSAAASALSELTDVTISSPQDKQVLTWDNTAEKWVNKSGSSADLTLTAAEWEAYTDEQKAALEDETIINIEDDYLPDMVMTQAEWEERKDEIGDGIMVTITDDETNPSFISDDFNVDNGVLQLERKIIDITNAAYEALPTSEKQNPKKYYNITDRPSGTDVDVIDGLTSTSATDALSAKQGKVLNDAIGTLNASLANISEMLTAENYASHFTVSPNFTNGFLKAYKIGNMILLNASLKKNSETSGSTNALTFDFGALNNGAVFPCAYGSQQWACDSIGYGYISSNGIICDNTLALNKWIQIQCVLIK